MRGSIISYPDRGRYGNNSYRGNCSGHVVKDFLKIVGHRTDELFVDPAEGGKTSRDVARELGVKYKGLDLRDGFNLLKDDLLARLGEPARSVFFHPPYAWIIRYSGNMWGNAPHPDDLSNCSSVEEFIGKLQLSLLNIYDALKSGGQYGVLMGNIRKDGTYIPLGPMTMSICPGRMKEEIVKAQHNCFSDSIEYSGKFVPISHEHLYIFEKSKVVFGLDYAIYHSIKAEMQKSMTWKNLVRRVLVKNSRPMTLSEIYEEIEGSEKAKANHHWKDKVRQVLQLMPEASRLDRGLFNYAA